MTAGHRLRAVSVIPVGFALLILALAIDFHLDVRERDVFSWMDPDQYYRFALGVLSGRESFNAFEVPSIFPFFVMPALVVSPSISAALWTNFAFTLVLLASIHALCRELEIRTPSPIVALLILSSPLLLGLSRTLYVEYALSAVVALAFVLWLRFLRSGDGRWGAGFGAVVGLGFMLKMTFPLFLILPVAAAWLARLRAGQTRDAYAIAASTLIPIGVVLLIQAAFFPRAFAYYLSLGNTTVPIMRLIGPPEWSSWRSATYYLGEVGRTLTLWLTPFLALAALDAARRVWQRRWADFSLGQVVLWLWLLGPLLVLTLQPVKEPRHVAPCVIPAVLLAVLWIESVSWSALRVALIGLAAILAVAQFIAVTGGHVEKPYFQDRALQWQAIRDAMIESSDLAQFADTPEADRLLHWKYDQNIVSVGFGANEALALSWQMFPAVVFDLEIFEVPGRLRPSIAYGRFEDLFILTAFNTYNRRTGWREYYETLSPDVVVANADFVIVNSDGVHGVEDVERRLPAHELVRTIAREKGSIHVLRRRRSHTTPYRALYADEFLRRNPGLSNEEKQVVMRELLLAAVLAGDYEEANVLERAHPELVEGEHPGRNIYWVGGYDTISELAGERLERRHAP